MAVLTPTPKQQVFGSDGAPLVGGKIFTYAGGTSTPIATYTDYTAGTANTNPIILDSLGQANIWLLTNTSYKFIVKTATDVLLYTVDNIITPIDITTFATPPPIGNTTPNTGAFTTLTASGAVTLTGTGAMKLNSGTTAERPTPSNGMIRYNTSTAAMEGYINSAWAGIGSVTSVATGAGLTGGPITSTGTISIDSTVATLTGTQTLTNKTIQGGAITSGTVVASTSGTSIDFTSIPSWVKRITVMFNNVSLAGAGSYYLIQLGTVSSIEVTGYQAVSTYSGNSGTGTITTGFPIFNNNVGDFKSGALILTIINSSLNTWVCSGSVSQFGVQPNYSMTTGGDKSIASVLTRLRLTTSNGTDTFDSGSVNILYEG
jgi:hypothetical protein